MLRYSLLASAACRRSSLVLLVARWFQHAWRSARLRPSRSSSCARAFVQWRPLVFVLAVLCRASCARGFRTRQHRYPPRSSIAFCGLALTAALSHFSRTCSVEAWPVPRARFPLSLSSAHSICHGRSHWPNSLGTASIARSYGRAPPNTSLQRTHRQSLRSFLFAAELDIVRRPKIDAAPSAFAASLSGALVHRRLPSASALSLALTRRSCRSCSQAELLARPVPLRTRTSRSRAHRIAGRAALASAIGHSPSRSWLASACGAIGALQFRARVTRGSSSFSVRGVYRSCLTVRLRLSAACAGAARPHRPLAERSRDTEAAA